MDATGIPFAIKRRDPTSCYAAGETNQRDVSGRKRRPGIGGRTGHVSGRPAAAWETDTRGTSGRPAGSRPLAAGMTQRSRAAALPEQRHPAMETFQGTF